MEPVKATITFSGCQIETVNVLDHDGRRTGQSHAGAWRAIHD